MQNIFLILFLSSSFLSFGQSSDTLGNQSAWYPCNKPTPIDSSIIHLKEGKVYFDFHIDEVPAKSELEDLTWFARNGASYFVSYLVNTTDSTFNAKRQDGSLMIIQEAIDPDGNWSPIEYWIYSGCGNSYFNPLTLAPGQSIMVPVRRYTGDFRTTARLRFKFGNGIILSDSFDASIDVTQFEREEGKVRGILFNGRANYFESN